MQDTFEELIHKMGGGDSRNGTAENDYGLAAPDVNHKVRQHAGAMILKNMSMMQFNQAHGC